MNEYQPTYDDPYTYGDSSDLFGDTSSGEDALAFGFILLTVLVIAVVAYVVHSIFLGMVFKKAGIEQWKAWVPVYNIWVTLEMGEQPGWWSLLMLIPVVNYVALVFYYIAQYRIGLKFGKDGVFVLLAIFLPLVWVIWLAVDKSVWRPNATNTKPVSAGPGTPSASM